MDDFDNFLAILILHISAWISSLYQLNIIFTSTIPLNNVSSFIIIIFGLLSLIFSFSIFRKVKDKPKPGQMVFVTSSFIISCLFAATAHWISAVFVFTSAVVAMANRNAYYKERSKSL